MRKVKEIKREESKKISHVYMITIIVTFLIFIVRFGQLMIFKTVNGQNLETLVQQLYNKKEVITAKRGNIYDVSGNLIATDIKTYAVYAVLSERYKGISAVKDKVNTAKILSKYIKLSEEDILKMLNQPELYQTSFGTAGTNLTYDEKKALEDEKLPGIYFTEKITRDYPKGYFSNNIIGLAQDTREDKSIETNENVLKGTMGLELQYNAQLKGIDGLVTYERDFYGLPIRGTESIIENVKNGNNIYTTLDSNLNDYLEQLVSQTYDTYKPTYINAMVVRPKTGDVVAATQRPTFNPKTQVYPTNGWVNQMVESSFEPGSTLKVITLAAAVNEGIFSPMDLYRSGNIKVGNITIQDWNVDGWGTISYLDGLARSSNVAFVNLVSQIGYDKWKSYLDAFGFGKSTDSGFANESKGMNTFSTEEVKATTSFGQGISVTNLQMLQAFTAIANGGTMQKLRFVDRVEKSDTKEVTYTPVETLGQPILSDTAKKVLKYLEAPVYNEGGTAVSYQLDNIRLGMKTGTAQIYNEAEKKYELGENAEYIYSLVSFLPSENPEFIIYITVRYGDSAPMKNLYKNFAPYALTYINKYSAPNTQNQTTSSSTTQQTKDETSSALVKIPDARHASVDQTKQAFNNLGFKQLLFLGNGTTVQKQMPVDNEEYNTSAKMMFYTGGEIKMPDMTGWSRQEVARFANLLNIQIEYNGDGFVIKQNIAPNTTVSLERLTLSVTLSSKSVPAMTTKQTTTTTKKSTN